MSCGVFSLGAAPCLRASLISESPAAPNGRAQIVIDEGAVMDVAGAIPGGPGYLSMRSPMSTRTKVLAGVNTSNPPPTSTVNRRSPPASAHGSAGGKMRAHAIGWGAGSNGRTPARARANGLHQVIARAGRDAKERFHTAGGNRDPIRDVSAEEVQLPLDPEKPGWKPGKPAAETDVVGVELANPS